MYQQLNLGKFLRSHYHDELGFLGDKYDENDVYVRVSNFDRCLLSATSQLAGLFPESDIPHDLFSIPLQTELQYEEFLLRGFDVWYAFFFV